MSIGSFPTYGHQELTLYQDLETISALISGTPYSIDAVGHDRGMLPISQYDHVEWHSSFVREAVVEATNPFISTRDFKENEDVVLISAWFRKRESAPTAKAKRIEYGVPRI